MTISVPLVGSPNELKLDRLRNDPRLVAAVEQHGDRLAATFPEVDGPLVDVHADERVGLAAIEVAAVLQGVVEGFLPVGEAVLDALLEEGRHLLHRLPA